MSRRAATGSEVTGGEPTGGEPTTVEAAEGTPRRPNLAGDLDEMLGPRPVFRTQLHGYDRLQVDNYAAWAESELATTRREVDELLSRYGTAAAELEISRRQLAEASRARVVFPVSGRIEEMLRLAADEAAAITEAGAQEAERLVAEARTEADARLRKAHEIKEMAGRERVEAAADRERARTDAEEILRAAVGERERLDEEAAERRRRADRAANAQLLAVQEQVDALRRQVDEARQSLRGLADRVGQALEAVVGTLPDGPAQPDLRLAVPRVRMVDNIVADGSDGTAEDRQPADGRPQPVGS